MPETFIEIGGGSTFTLARENLSIKGWVSFCSISSSVIWGYGMISGLQIENCFCLTITFIMKGIGLIR